MTKQNKKTILWTMILTVSLIVIDQIIKIWVKTHMVEHQIYDITSWFKIFFIENAGMAYGITIGSKLFLTLFRIIAMGLATYFFIRLIPKRKWSVGFLICLCLVIAGGIGNIIDSVFYGCIFSTSTNGIAHFVPFGQGYAPLLYGHVVDMFYFPIIQTTYPSWFPFWGGEPFVFFSPIFNFADSCISVGVVAILLFYSKSVGIALDLLFGKNKSKYQDKDITK